MAQRVAWTESAWQELEAAGDYIARDSPRTLRMRGRVVPELSDRAVCELFVKNYRLIYEARDQTVAILAFIHGTRRFPIDPA